MLDMKHSVRISHRKTDGSVIFLFPCPDVLPYVKNSTLDSLNYPTKVGPLVWKMLLIFATFSPASYICFVFLSSTYLSSLMYIGQSMKSNCLNTFLISSNFPLWGWQVFPVCSSSWCLHFNSWLLQYHQGWFIDRVVQHREQLRYTNSFTWPWCRNLYYSIALSKCWISDTVNGKDIYTCILFLW